MKYNGIISGSPTGGFRVAWQSIFSLKLEYGCDPCKVCTLKAGSSDMFASDMFM